MQAVEGLKTKGDKKKAAEQIKALYETFVKSDCTMVEVRMRASASQMQLIYRSEDMPVCQMLRMASWLHSLVS